MTPKRSKLIDLGFLSSIVLAAMPAGAQDGPLSPQEIQAKWVGKTMVGIIGSGPTAGSTIEFTMNTDGTAAVRVGGLIRVHGARSEQGYCATQESDSGWSRALLLRSFAKELSSM
ncbi:MAG: hypothetical protein IPG23_25340 [Burkholderiales bacterium]|nr:hypothetical protein [Burkholderiales bacterium]